MFYIAKKAVSFVRPCKIKVKIELLYSVVCDCVLVLFQTGCVQVKV